VEPRNYVKYTFLEVDPAWRRRSPEERAADKREFAAACAEFDPERAADATAVPAEDIRAAAEALGRTGPVAYYAWNGVAQNAEATQTDRAIALLMALKGGYDAPGGNVLFDKLPRNTVNGFDLYPDGQLEKALGRAERPLGPPSQGWVMPRDVYTAILEHKPYPVRALVGFGGNMAVSHADPDRAREALRALEFHVHCDMVETPTARFADILLPVNSPWEREGLRMGFASVSEMGHQTRTQDPGQTGRIGSVSHPIPAAGSRRAH
jgi:anaerobic selenocysteine-containing dehydrogenase